MLRRPMLFLPIDVQNDWSASLHQMAPTEVGVYRVIEKWGDNEAPGVQRLTAGYENLRVRVRVIDENEQPIAGVQVAFHFSTSTERYLLGPDFLWVPPVPHRAFVTKTSGEGIAEQIQNDVVKYNQAGGITVYVLDPKRSSDFVQGLGMLADHTGIEITFQRQDHGVVPMDDRIAGIERSIVDLQAQLIALEGRIERASIYRK